MVSPKFGIGKLIGIESLSGMNGSFYHIEGIGHNAKNLVPINSDTLIRKVSTQDSFHSSLEKTCEENVWEEFETRKDRISCFQEVIKSNKSTLDDILGVIRHIHQLDNKGAVERQMMNDLLQFVAKEYAFVFDCEHEEAVTKLKETLLN